MPTIYEVANYFLAESSDNLTNRKLQKLLYFAQGFHLAKYDCALFEGDFAAWKFGPVNSGIFHEYKAYGYQPISRPKPESLVQFSERALSFIASFLIAFSSIGQEKLIEYSHADIPWAAHYIPNQNVRISQSDLRDYFAKFHSFEEYITLSEKKLDFHNLISNRAKYLETLPNIGNEWISGNAAAPLPEITLLAQKFLSGFERYVFSSEAKPQIPRLIMGPIPEGGVSLEFHTGNATYLHFHNRGELEIEKERNGYFTEETASFDQLNEDFTEFYKIVIE